MRKCLHLLCFSLLMLCSSYSAGQHDKGCCDSRFAPAQLDSLPIPTLAKEYRRLRRRGRWCSDCSDWLSGQHEVMVALSSKLVGLPPSQVRRFMGKPDEKEDGKWFYDWRDGHDAVFFDFPDGRARSFWYHAYE